MIGIAQVLPVQVGRGLGQSGTRWLQCRENARKWPWSGNRLNFIRRLWMELGEMKKLLTGISAAALVMGASVMALRAQAQNVWSGVFTADQAAQGKAVFDGKCAM